MNKDMLIKHCTLQSDDASAPALRAALEQLAALISTVDGIVGVDLYRDAANAAQFVLLERWQSQEAYDRGSVLIDKNAVRAVIALLNDKPVVRTLTTMVN